MADTPSLTGGADLGDFARPAHIPSNASFGKSRAAGLAVAVVAHVMLVLGLLFFHLQPEKLGVIYAAPIKISLIKPPPVPVVLIPTVAPKMLQAPAITAPIPIFTIEAPQPPAQPPAPPAPPAPAAGPATATAPLDTAAYLAALHRRLDKFNTSPPSGENGTAVVEFVIDKAGKLLSARISQSSGSNAIDDYALSVVRRADPLPPIPVDFHLDQLETHIGISIKAPDVDAFAGFGRRR